MKLFIVDAFTDKIFGGNPAGVAILENGEDYPEDELMRKTAAELRYSETVFVKRISKVEFELRYFTPTSEVDLCGHATIAAFTAITAKPVMKLSKKKYYGCGCYHKYDELGTLRFKAHTKAGILEIEVNNGTVFMDMGKAESLGGVPDERLYRIFDTEPMADLKPEIVSTGLPDILMPVKNLEALNSLAPDFPALAEFSKELNVVGVHAFTIINSEVHARNFAPAFGIDEEAATGTANGALTYYLYERNIFVDDNENIIVQGEAMDRASKITTIISKEGARIQVGGRGVILSDGTLFL